VHQSLGKSALHLNSHLLEGPLHMRAEHQPQ
jgi:hypothetical protein